MLYWAGKDQPMKMNESSRAQGKKPMVNNILNQVVFSSINYGTDTSAEGRCIIRELLKTTYDGVGPNGQTAIFPIQIWKKKKGVSYLPTDKNYDLYQFACKVTAKRFFPNFVNLDAPFNSSNLSGLVTT